MDPEKQAISSTSKSVLKSTSREGSICSEKSRQREPQNSGKSAKVKKNQDKKIIFIAPPAAVKLGSPNLHEAVNKLHDRTKRVRAKLSSKLPPKYEIPSKAMKTAAQLTKDPLDGLPSEEDLCKEIERLQELVRKLRVKNKSSETSDSKSTERRESSKSDKGDPKTYSEGSGDEVSVDPQHNTEGKPKRKRNKKKQKITDEGQLQELYVSHINQIIDNTDVKDPKIPQFKNKDDLEEFATKCVEAGLGRIVEAELRVSTKNNHQAFITMEGASDAIILSTATRRYAMDGDIVKAFVRNKTQSAKESVGDLDESMPTFGDPLGMLDDPEDVLVNYVDILKKSKDSDRAFVIEIVKESGNRQFVGSIAFKNPCKHDDGEYFKFKTRDTKAPIMCISVESCNEILEQYQSDDILGLMFVAQIVKIEENGRCLGKLVAPIGRCGNLEDEIKAILMHNRLTDVQPFEKRFEDMWADPIKIEKSDLKNRGDLRGDCIFTIDPLTARDLDDAVSCKKLGDGRYEIGVHISDVAHYLKESSELDELVKLRATSIYLVNEVIHMLPQTLCMKCSLLPNEDKFTLSVFWIMDRDANVVSTRFTRSVIRSCTQLAYEHAQKIIDNPNESFNNNDFPTICNGFNATDIVERVKTLNSLAEVMRSRRFQNGSISIDKPQFYFHFDPKTGEPTSYEIANRLTANFLIEEFMLLANQSVARFIYDSFPDIAILRSHQPPKPSAIKRLKIKLKAVGIELDVSTSKSIFDGLKNICGSSSSPEVVSVAMNYLLTKPMMRAKYFCSENVNDEIMLRHYALSIPIYTHFTSPIRRYPDVMVHRLLSAALKYTPVPKRTHEELHELAHICNDQKFNAKNAGEESSNLYFKRFIKEKKYLNVRAVVVDIFNHSVEVITIETGHLIPIPFKLQTVVVDSKKAPTAIYISEKNSTKPPVELKMFSEVNIRLKVWDGKLTGFFVSPEPEQRIKNEIASHSPKPDRKKELPESLPTSNEPNTTRKRNRRRKRSRNAAKKSLALGAIDTKIDEESN